MYVVSPVHVGLCSVTIKFIKIASQDKRVKTASVKCKIHLLQTKQTDQILTEADQNRAI